MLNGKELINFMKKFAKRFLSILLLSALTITYLFTLTGCFRKRHYEENGVKYFLSGNGEWEVECLYDKNLTGDYMYIRDKIKGENVMIIGYFPPYWGIPEFHQITGDKAIRIYFPWSIEYSLFEDWKSDENDVTEYIISASTKALVSDVKIENNKGGGKYVVSNYVFNEIEKGVFKRIHNVSNIEIENFIPANIVYFFNYEDEPNKGYFFIDIQEETGKLIKPPYDPQRKWYKFDGWYTESECINKWDFDNDEVTITYDEDGNRIYEEIKLYAKWKRSLFGI